MDVRSVPPAGGAVPGHAPGAEAAAPEPVGPIPARPRHYVPRRRLWARLDETTRLGVTLVTGLVGTGKTLGVAGWLHDRGHDRRGAVWVHADPGLGPEVLAELLRAAGQGGAGARGEPPVVVIDDAHELTPECVRLIDTLLRDAPTSLRLVLASRWDLPLTRLVPELLGHLSVLRGDLLRMTDEEATELVGPHLRVSDPALVGSVVAWAHGWCAMLVLTAHAVGRAREPAAAVERLTRGAAPVADQVASEVFAAMTPEQRHLLLCLAGEGPFSARLAIHLTGDRAAEEVLAELETTGLLVTRVPAPDAQTWFVIHPLLLEAVRRHLAAGGEDADRARAAVAAAVGIDLAAGQVRRALPRLLRLYAFDEAAQVVAHEGVRLLVGAGDGEEVAAAVREQPEMIDAHPSTWFAVGLDRWLVDDAEAIRHWAERILAAADDSHDTDTDQAGGTDADADAERPVAAHVACARLWRAKLGLEPLEPAVESARVAADDGLAVDRPDEVGSLALPVLLMELGTAEAWLGAPDEARTRLVTCLGLCRSQGLRALRAAAMSHLALSELMAGRDRAAAEVATEAFGFLEDVDSSRLRFAPSRAGLARFLSGASTRPWETAPIPVAVGDAARRTHGCDLAARFWSRVRDALTTAGSGSLPEARRALVAPVADPQLQVEQLPAHLRVVVLVGEALLADLSADPSALARAESALAELGAAGESCFVAGLRADCQGSRHDALAAFEHASREATCAQPPVRAMSLACAAQLRDSTGDGDAALDLLAQAAAETDVRGNSVAFLGWVRQGSPVESLLRRLDARGGSARVHELAGMAAGHADVVSRLESASLLRQEAPAAEGPLVVPALSPREREVLGELARGATYADIGAALFLSINTVKTHVSSLYAKLGVTRRSDALALARSHHIL